MATHKHSELETKIRVCVLLTASSLVHISTLFYASSKVYNRS